MFHRFRELSQSFRRVTLCPVTFWVNPATVFSVESSFLFSSACKSSAKIWVWSIAGKRRVCEGPVRKPNITIPTLSQLLWFLRAVKERFVITGIGAVCEGPVPQPNITIPTLSQLLWFLKVVQGAVCYHWHRSGL